MIVFKCRHMPRKTLHRRCCRSSSNTWSLVSRLVGLGALGDATATPLSYLDVPRAAVPATALRSQGSTSADSLLVQFAGARGALHDGRLWIRPQCSNRRRVRLLTAKAALLRRRPKLPRTTTWLGGEAFPWRPAHSRLGVRCMRQCLWRGVVVQASSSTDHPKTREG